MLLRWPRAPLRCNLQDIPSQRAMSETPTRFAECREEKAMNKNPVTFKSGGVNIAGNLYCPDDFTASKRYPAIVAAGPMATVKEQAAGVFAKALSEKGFIALAFDYRTYGESEGEPRQYENPVNKTEDIQNAISFLSAHENVDSEGIGALGVCASSSYIATALASDRRVKAFGTVSAFFSLREFCLTNPFVTDEQRNQTSNEIKVIEGAYHVQAYDRPEYVSQAVGALSRFFQQHLAA